MGFLDNLKDKAEDFGDKAKEGFEAAKDKASDLVGDVKDRFDGDETSEDKVDAAADYSPEAVEEASQGIGEAVDDATLAAEASAPADVDPLDPEDPALESVEPVSTSDIDPLDPEDPALESLDPVSTSGGDEDPLDGGPSRAGGIG